MADAPPAPDADTQVPDAWQARVAGTMINPATLLATDYLNHFNEVIMTIDMVPDMPELLEEVQGWRLRTYAEHFQASGLDYGALAAEAYDHVPAATKRAFEATVMQMRAVIQLALKRLQASLALNDTEEVRRTAKAAAATLTALCGTANGIIAGARETMQQSEIDRLLSSGPTA
jgi:hypothetical protein